MSQYVKVGVKADFPENQTKGVQIEGVDICIANYKGQITALHGWCTHAEALLAGSEIEEGEISCPLHGARFSVTTGDAMTPPAVRPLQLYEVKIVGDNVLVKIDHEKN